jgi:hypothetical protein
MNYDKIILELLSRVQELEEQMEIVNDKLLKLKTLNNNGEDIDQGDTQGDITRTKAREEAMKIIRTKFPEYIVEKASRNEGSGIKIIKPGIEEERAIIIKFFYSKTYDKNSDGIEHAWHTVNLDDIIGSFIDFVMFSVVDKNGNSNFLIYKPSELGLYSEKYRSKPSEQLHLYFYIENDKAFEIRENKVDVSDHLNNWSVLE